MALRVELVTPESEVWSGGATMVVARTIEGDLGVLTGHEPMLAVLAPGVVTITPESGEPVRMLVPGGFLSVADDRVSVLAESAEPVDGVDTASAQNQLREAEANGDDQAAARARARIVAAASAH